MNDINHDRPLETHSSLQRNGTLYTVRPLKDEQFPQKYLCTVSKVTDDRGNTQPVRVGNTLVLLTTRKGFSTFLEYVGFRKKAIEELFRNGPIRASEVSGRWDKL